MGSEPVAFPLTVWAGSNRYTFSPGRDFTVGRDDRADVPLADPEHNQGTSRFHLLLRFDGSQWVAIDTSRNGTFIADERISRTHIRDGMTVTLADPHRGPRLLFHVGAPQVHTRPPGRPLGPRSWRKGRTAQRAIPVPGPHPPQHPSPQPPPVPPSRSATPLRPPSERPTGPVPVPNKPPERATGKRTDPGAEATPLRPQSADPPSQAPTGPIPIPHHDEATAPATTPIPTPHFQPPPPPHRKEHPAPPRSAPPASPPPRPEPAPPTAAPQRTGGRGLQVQRLQVAVDGHQGLTDVSFTAHPGTLTAVIGPAGSGKTTLVDTLAGLIRPGGGAVVLDGHGVDAATRSRVGLVPPHDVVHPQLTVEQALHYAAELRLPPGTSAEERRRVVHQVLAELDLRSRRTIQIGSLSREARKRASIAAELVTEPSLLVLDEPGAGLDPVHEYRTMATLRRLADTGRVVVVATESPANLHLCDQLVLLTANGTVAFAGPPAQLRPALGTGDWSQIFHRLTAEPDAAHQSFLTRQSPPQPAAPVEPAAAAPRLPKHRQIAVAARRQAWLLVGDQRYFIFLTLLPILFGALALIVPGHTGFGRSDLFGDGPDEAVELLALLTVAAVTMGTALAIRGLAGERGIFTRERSLGFSPSAYVAAKVLVYSLVVIVQTGVVTTAAVVGKGPPANSAMLLGDPVVELYVAVAATGIVSALLVLALASFAKHSEQLLLTAVLVILLSIVFCGAMFPLAGDYGFDVFSWFVPARWGFAAAAASVDLDSIDVVAPKDPLWTHSTGHWLSDVAVLVAFAAASVAVLHWRLREPTADSNLVTTKRKARV
jgi:ABC-type multidrug transport system ATPase subunit